MRVVVRTLVLAAALAAFPACGGGGTSIAFSSTNGGSSTSGGIVLESRAAVVATDVDGDGLADLVAVPRDGASARDGSSVGACWRNAGRAGFADASAAFREAPTSLAVLDDCASRADSDLADGFGCHVAASRSTRGAAYAVVHLGDGVADVGGPPSISTLDPTSAPVRSLLVISGHALAAPGEVPAVTIGGVGATVLYAFADALIVVVPAGLGAGPADVRVTRGALESPVVTFTVIDARTPSVTAILPSRVQQGGRAVVRGDDLGGPLDTVGVTISGLAVTSILPLFQALVIEVPTSAVSGSLVVTVNGRASLPFFVEVGGSPTPTITSLTPASACPGSLVRISGTDLVRLGSSTSVTFGGIEAAIYGFGDGELTAIVPTGALDGDVVVTTADLASSGAPFDVGTRRAPVIDAISPTTASIGEVVRITGTDLVDLSAWKPNRLPTFPLFGDVRVTVGGADAWFLLPSPGAIDVLVPFGAVTGSVVVTVGGQPSNAVTFTKR